MKTDRRKNLAKLGGAQPILFRSLLEDLLVVSPVRGQLHITARQSDERKYCSWLRVMYPPQTDQNSLGSPYVQRQVLRPRVHLLAHSCRGFLASGQRPLQLVMQPGFSCKLWSNCQLDSEEYFKKFDDVLFKGLDLCCGPLLFRQVFVMSCEEPTQRNDGDGLSEIRATDIPSLPH